MRPVRLPAPSAADQCSAAASIGWSAHTRPDPTTPALHSRALSARRAPPAAAEPEPARPTTTTTAREKKAQAARRGPVLPHGRRHALGPVPNRIAATYAQASPPDHDQPNATSTIVSRDRAAHDGHTAGSVTARGACGAPDRTPTPFQAGRAGTTSSPCTWPTST